jgi:hypothetical protein
MDWLRPCPTLYVYSKFSCLNLLLYPEDGGSIFLINFDKLLLDRMASLSGKHYSP